MGLKLDSIPEINKSCEKCMYLDASKSLISWLNLKLDDEQNINNFIV